MQWRDEINKRNKLVVEKKLPTVKKTVKCTRKTRKNEVDDRRIEQKSKEWWGLRRVRGERGRG